MELQQRKDLALSYHARGYNCAQSVVLAFSDLTGLDAATATRLSMAFGAGIGQGSVCGVVIGMGIVAGMLHPADPKMKIKAYADVRDCSERFRQLNDGRWLCRELKSGDSRRSCDDLIADGVEILDGLISRTQDS